MERWPSLFPGICHTVSQTLAISNSIQFKFNCNHFNFIFSDFNIEFIYFKFQLNFIWILLFFFNFNRLFLHPFLKGHMANAPKHSEDNEEEEEKESRKEDYFQSRRSLLWHCQSWGESRGLPFLLLRLWFKSGGKDKGERGPAMEKRREGKGFWWRGCFLEMEVGRDSEKMKKNSKIKFKKILK